jgi:hypothetical protein
MSVTPTITATPSTTPIICGAGLTTGNYYYTDCCGNFVQGTEVGILVSLNYSKASNGIVKLNTNSEIFCPTPSPTQTPTYTSTNTPSPTVTPTVTTTSTLTPTPSVTPSFSAVYKLKNDCEVFTLFDMGVSCFPVVQPSSRTSNDGILSLKITGGTSPYSIYWEGGQRSQTLVGVPEGSYEVVVVDYYGDYSAQTICSLFGPSQTPTPSITPSPTLTPSPVWPNLCLLVIYPTTTFGPYQFVPNGSQNGKPSWRYSTYNVVWNIENNRWEIQGWDKSTGIPVSTNSSFIPTSAWSIAGGPQATVTMTQGTCPEYAPLQAQLAITNSTCNGTQNCNGSISVTTSYGLAPYTYSINNGVTYQSSNIFNGLCPNTYTVLVKDSVGSVLSKIATLGYDEAPVTYTIGVALNNVIDVDSSQKISNWKVNVTPALPVGTSITFDLNVSNSKQYQGPGTGVISGNTIVTKNGANVPGTSSTPTLQISPRPNCSPYQTTATTSSSVYTITMNSGDVVSGTSTSIISVTDPVNAQNGCVTTLVQDILVSTSSPVKNGCSCCSVVNNGNSVGIVKHTVVGSVTLSPPPTQYDFYFEVVNPLGNLGGGSANLSGGGTLTNGNPTYTKTLVVNTYNPNGTTITADSGNVINTIQYYDSNGVMQQQSSTLNGLTTGQITTYGLFMTNNGTTLSGYPKLKIIFKTA